MGLITSLREDLIMVPREKALRETMRASGRKSKLDELSQIIFKKQANQ